MLTNDQKVRDIEQLGPGEYPPDDTPVPDTDSNGWPQTGRNKALRAMRRGFAVHISGDQHLGSTVQYGVDEWGDSGYAICVPSVANFWPRRWYPVQPGANRAPGSPRYSGDHFDPFGNRVTVFTVSNPVKTGRQPLHLYDKAPGYGIVRFDRAERTISFECWSRWADPSRPGSMPYAGWPVVAGQQENYGRTPVAWLPTIQVRGMIDPVVQIVDEATGEIVYTLRIAGNAFRPYVFEEGMYTVRIGEQGTDLWREYTGVMSDDVASRDLLTVEY